jgi:hypothetical protein
MPLLKNLCRCVAEFVVSLAVLLSTNWATAQDANLTLAAEPQHVWVHYDYMVFPPGSVYPRGNVYPNGVSMAPSRAAIDMVVDAFAKQGLTLHIDPVHNAIPGHQIVIPDFNPAWRAASQACVGSDDAVSFLKLKQQYFHPDGDHPWHYAIFGYSGGLSALEPNGNACPVDPLCGGYPDPNSSGYSELPGFNFILALGSLTEGVGLTLDQISNYDNIVASVFMHELGHNFGLEHGGVVNSNGLFPPESCDVGKPNYISVMNYRYNINGIPYAATPGSNIPVDYHQWRVDYSSFTALTLTETDLDEFAGIGGPPGDTDIVIICAQTTCPLYGPSSGPIDWNGDGVIEAHAAADIDCFFICGLPPNSFPLHGFDDWSYVKQQLQIPPDVIDQLPKRAVH